MPNDPVTLDDLLVATPRFSPAQAWIEEVSRPATLDDLVQVLEGMGAKRRVALMQNRTGPLGRLSVSVDEPGSYLVLRLED